MSTVLRFVDALDAEALAVGGPVDAAAIIEAQP